jgi:hypothetical protein
MVRQPHSGLRTLPEQPSPHHEAAPRLLEERRGAARRDWRVMSRSRSAAVMARKGMFLAPAAVIPDLDLSCG